MRKLDYYKIITEIQDWIKYYVDSANVNGIVVGISGGIDSAVTTTLCVNAIGKENVIGLGLPCSSNPEDLKDAIEISQMLGIRFIKIELTEIYNKFLDITGNIVEPNRMANANLKPRLRMMTIYFIAQSLGKNLVVGTSNRTEIAIGYFTKFGDGAADFEPIGSFYKCEVREIAKILNLPEKVIKKPPSAGLWPDQTDEGEIGINYDILDEIIYRIDHKLNLDELNQENVDKVKKMMESSHHKNNMPPIFKINFK